MKTMPDSKRFASAVGVGGVVCSGSGMGGAGGLEVGAGGSECAAGEDGGIDRGESVGFDPFEAGAVFWPAFALVASCM